MYYHAHGEAEAAQLENIGDGHANEMHLAKQKAGDEDNARCCNSSMEQCRPQRRVTASQHEHENHVFERLVNALPAQEQRGVKHSGGQGCEHNAGGIQMKRGGQREAAGMRKAFAANDLQSGLLNLKEGTMM